MKFAASCQLMLATILIIRNAITIPNRSLWRETLAAHGVEFEHVGTAQVFSATWNQLFVIDFPFTNLKNVSLAGKPKCYEIWPNQVANLKLNLTFSEMLREKRKIACARNFAPLVLLQHKI
jgi:hypothetical protein